MIYQKYFLKTQTVTTFYCQTIFYIIVNTFFAPQMVYIHFGNPPRMEKTKYSKKKKKPITKTSNNSRTIRNTWMTFSKTLSSNESPDFKPAIYSLFQSVPTVSLGDTDKDRHSRSLNTQKIHDEMETNQMRKNDAHQKHFFRTARGCS